MPFFIRTGKHLPVTQTELRIVFKRPPRLGFGARAAARVRTSWWSSSTRRPASASAWRPSGPTASGRRAITLDMEFADRGWRGTDAVRGAAERRARRRQQPLPRQDGIEEAWRIMQPLLDAPPPVNRTPRVRGARRPPTGCSPAWGTGRHRGPDRDGTAPTEVAHQRCATSMTRRERGPGPARMKTREGQPRPHPDTEGRHPLLRLSPRDLSKRAEPRHAHELVLACPGRQAAPPRRGRWRRR